MSRRRHRAEDRTSQTTTMRRAMHDMHSVNEIHEVNAVNEQRGALSGYGRAVLWALSGADMADTVFLRRITGLDRDGLRAELAALEDSGLIQRRENGGFLYGLLTSRRGETYYGLTELGREHTEVSGLVSPPPTSTGRLSKGEVS